jgi:hypothetical protein
MMAFPIKSLKFMNHTKEIVHNKPIFQFKIVLKKIKGGKPTNQRIKVLGYHLPKDVFIVNKNMKPVINQD